MIKGIINERCLRTSSMHMWQFKNGWVTQFTNDTVHFATHQSLAGQRSSAIHDHVSISRTARPRPSLVLASVALSIGTFFNDLRRSFVLSN